VTMIRRPAVAGMFYPARRDDLERMVRTFIEGSGRSPDDTVAGLVSPHAGYVYSGAVAGAAYATAPDDVEAVLILAPPHRFAVRGASVFDGDGYATPLGDAPVSRPITEALLKAGYSFQPQAHMSEHSAEVQVPFIQVRWSGVEIAVILQGDSSLEFSMELAGAVAGSVEHLGRTLVVASSDLSHYHSLRVARAKDRMMIEAFTSGDPSRMNGALAGGGEACGTGPIITLMQYAELSGCSRFGEIRWTTSADASGDSSSVVGYFAGYCGK
jgi:AmmeMemoRadiSam system protein B